MAEPLPQGLRRSTPQRQQAPTPGLNFGMNAVQIDAQTNQQVGQAASNVMVTAADVLGHHYDKEQDRDHTNSLTNGKTQANNLLTHARQAAAGTKDPKERRKIFLNQIQHAEAILNEKGDTQLFRQPRTKQAALDWWKNERTKWETEAAVMAAEADSENITQLPYNAMELAKRKALDPDSYYESHQEINENIKLLKETPEHRTKIQLQKQEDLDRYYAQTRLDAIDGEILAGSPSALVNDKIDDEIGVITFVLKTMPPKEREEYVNKFKQLRIAVAAREKAMATQAAAADTSWYKKNASKASEYMAKNQTTLSPQEIERKENGRPVFNTDTRTKLWQTLNAAGEDAQEARGDQADEFMAKNDTVLTAEQIEQKDNAGKFIYSTKDRTDLWTKLRKSEKETTKTGVDTTAKVRNMKLIKPYMDRINTFVDSDDGTKSLLLESEIRARVTDKTLASALVTRLRSKLDDDPAGFEYKAYAFEIETMLHLDDPKITEHGGLDKVALWKLYGNNVDQLKVIWQDPKIDPIQKRKLSDELIQPMKQKADLQKLLRNLRRKSVKDLTTPNTTPDRIHTKGSQTPTTGGYESHTDDELKKILGL